MPHSRRAVGGNPDSSLRNTTHLQYYAYLLAIRGRLSSIYSSRKHFGIYFRCLYDC